MDRRMIGEDAISFLKKKNSLLDSTLTSLCMQDAEGSPIIDLCFAARAGADYEVVRIKFSGIKEFGFYYNDKHSFYVVEDFKFLVTSDGLFYLSVDPDRGQDGESETDQDFVRAKYVEIVTN